MISLEQISFSYPGDCTGSLRIIDLQVQKGECILLCGRSGCGKTTITRLVNGLIPHFYSGQLQGNVTVDEMNISKAPMYMISETVGSVFQNPRTQFFNIDTDSEIAFGIENAAYPREELRQRVETTTKELKLENLRGRNIFELSGGEKQKIAFASVYATNPDVYLLDEPSSNLDMRAIQELKEHLVLAKKQGKTIIIAEHRLYYLMDLVDRILYLEHGRIAKTFRPQELDGLSAAEREKMGLRATDLYEVHPVVQAKLPKQPVLELRNVAIRHQKRVVLENMNLNVSRGEVIAIAGHNGAGKTTFSRALCGLHKNCEGSFFWEGQAQEAKARLKRSYMVMQDVGYQLFAESVEAECSLGIKKPDSARITDTLDKLGLTPYKDRHPNTLSGGQKQLTAVAVSMICRKEVLIFDEPTSGLDFDNMIQVAGLIQQLSEMGKVIFVVTHDYEFMCRTCSRVLHVDEGKIKDDISVSNHNEEKLRELFSLPKQPARQQEGVCC